MKSKVILKCKKCKYKIDFIVAVNFRSIASFCPKCGSLMEVDEIIDLEEENNKRRFKKWKKKIKN